MWISRAPEEERAEEVKRLEKIMEMFEIPAERYAEFAAYAKTVAETVGKDPDVHQAYHRLQQGDPKRHYIIAAVGTLTGDSFKRGMTTDEAIPRILQHFPIIIGRLFDSIFPKHAH